MAELSSAWASRTLSVSRASIAGFTSTGAGAEAVPEAGRDPLPAVLGLEWCAIAAKSSSLPRAIFSVRFRSIMYANITSLECSISVTISEFCKISTKNWSKSSNDVGSLVLRASLTNTRSWSAISSTMACAIWVAI